MERTGQNPSSQMSGKKMKTGTHHHRKFLTVSFLAGLLMTGYITLAANENSPKPENPVVRSPAVVPAGLIETSEASQFVAGSDRQYVSSVTESAAPTVTRFDGQRVNQTAGDRAQAQSQSSSPRIRRMLGDNQGDSPATSTRLRRSLSDRGSHQLSKVPTPVATPVASQSKKVTPSTDAAKPLPLYGPFISIKKKATSVEDKTAVANTSRANTLPTEPNPEAHSDNLYTPTGPTNHPYVLRIPPLEMVAATEQNNPAQELPPSEPYKIPPRKNPAVYETAQFDPISSNPPNRSVVALHSKIDNTSAPVTPQANSNKLQTATISAAPPSPQISRAIPTPNPDTTRENSSTTNFPNSGETSTQQLQLKQQLQPQLHATNPGTSLLAPARGDLDPHRGMPAPPTSLVSNTLTDYLAEDAAVHEKKVVQTLSHHQGENFCCPTTWYAMAEPFALNREGEDGVTMSDAFDLGDFDYALAGRVTVGRRYDCVDGFEISYAGQFESTLRGTAFGLLTGNAGTLDSTLSTAGVDISPFNGADVHTQTYRSRLNSAEIVKKWWGWDVIAVSLGARFIHQGDNFLFEADGAANGNGSLRVATRNYLLGPQLGLEMYHPVGAWSFDFKGKASIYGNMANSQTVLWSNGSLPIDNKADNVAFSAMLDFGYYLSYRVSPRLTLRAGYEFWWIHGLAIAPDQLRGPLNHDSGIHLFSNGDALYHGGVVGAEWLF